MKLVSNIFQYLSTLFQDSSAHLHSPEIICYYSSSPVYYYRTTLNVTRFSDISLYNDTLWWRTNDTEFRQLL